VLPAGAWRRRRRRRAFNQRVYPYSKVSTPQRTSIP